MISSSAVHLLDWFGSLYKNTSLAAVQLFGKARYSKIVVKKTDGN